MMFLDSKKVTDVLYFAGSSGFRRHLDVLSNSREVIAYPNDLKSENPIPFWIILIDVKDSRK
ncbi:hypothetical protein AtNW77_Chr4g0301851 [Arabidopsis thaliana]